MVAGAIEAMRVPTNPLDVLAQQTIAAAAVDEWDVEGWFELVRRAAPFATLPRSAFDATLDLLAGRYPSDRFGDLRPRIVWDRDAGTIVGRRGAQRLAVTSGGTIPDRGLFGVFMIGEAGPGRRVGELDEEMVYESRVGDVFALGATSWRIQEITHDRVLVAPAFGEPGRLPFWKGDGIGRPAELGEAIGGFITEIANASPEAGRARARTAGLDERAASNLVAFIADQRAATRVVPDATNLVVERFRDELGDWRIVLHSPYGMRVHAPWALAAGARVQERFGVDANAVASDDGIVLRMPDTSDDPPGAELFAFEPAELAELVTLRVGDSALFASRFRECAARALLLPRLNPGRRSPLWQQRQRASQLLEVARDFPDFPIVLEAVRECLQDVYDLPALTRLTERIGAREVRFVEVTTETASPFASSLLFGYVGAFMYEGDAPLAERRAAALSLDPALLAELLGTVELRELLDPEVVAETERMLQRLVPERAARGEEGVADLLRELGPAHGRRGRGALRRGDGCRGDARRARRRATRRPGAIRRHRVVRRGRRPEPPPRRARRADPAGPARGVRRARARSARRPREPLRPHARPVHGARRGRAVRHRPGHRRLRTRPARGRAPRRRGGVPAARRRRRVVRQRGAATHPAPLARRPPQRGRARRAARVRPVPARVAARRRAPARRRRRRRGHRAARGRPHPRLGVGVVRAARARRRLPAGHARRAHRLRRGALGRAGVARGRRRLGEPAPRRHRRAHPSRRRPPRRSTRSRPSCSRRWAAGAATSSGSSSRRSARPTSSPSSTRCGDSPGRGS